MTRPIEETLREALRYDYDSGKLFWKDDWHPEATTSREVGGEWKSKNCATAYIRFQHREHRLMAHRVIWFLHYGEWPDGEIDHIDGDGLNNRIENLRLSTRRTNSYNRPMYKCNKTGYKGVGRRHDEKRYHARIRADNVQHSLGYFDTAEEAARAYDRKAIELHGEYARTNFPIEDYLGA